MISYEAGRAMQALRVVRAFAEAAGVTTLEVRCGEHGVPEDGTRVPTDQAIELVRAMLRGQAWCKLEAPDDTFYVHIGYDLYMYVGASTPLPGVAESIRKTGLFVDEDFTSLYLPERAGP